MTGMTNERRVGVLAVHYKTLCGNLLVIDRDCTNLNILMSAMTGDH